MASDVLAVRYCEGWDPATRSVVGPISEATARDRDAAGTQYAAALFDPAGDRPVGVVEMAWQEHYACAWHIDGQGRRDRRFEYRRLADGRIFLRSDAAWTYHADDQAEFDEHADEHRRQYEPDGSGEVHDRGGTRVQAGPLMADPATLFRPPVGFGDLTALYRVGPPTPSLEVVDWPDGPPVTPPWRPARPLQPRNLDVMFRAGTRLTETYIRESVIEVAPAGELVLPSGQLAACDPAMLEFDDVIAPFEATVDPGRYPVQLSVARGTTGGAVIAGARLVIRDEPVTRWEPALCAGQDPILLADGHFYGFGVDAGMGCFFDFAVREALQPVIEEAEETITDTPSDRPCLLTDPASGATLIAYWSGCGDGSYPTWIGRTAAGDIACFVSDMLVLGDATIL